MESGGNVYNNNHINCSRGQSSSDGNLGWDLFDPNTSSRFEWTNGNTLFATDESTNHSLIFQNQSPYYHRDQQDGGEGLSQFHPDPHLMCLKLGKRHYFEDTIPVGYREMAIGKRGKPYYSVVGGQVGLSSSSAGCTVTVPRCQVEGCYVALVNAKDYHRRHKVCEMHSKAPKVIVLGLEQRFCQQCSRFHVVSEFDDAKRSCRRRLAGHNERRRKSAHHSLSRNFCQDKFTPTGRAPSLLSSKVDSLISTSDLDLSSRSSAALRELIAENRAAQLLLERHLHHNDEIEDLSLSSHHSKSQPSTNNSFIVPHQHHYISPNNWDTSTQITLNLMHTPTSPFGFFSTRGKNKQVEQECHELWNNWAGPHEI